MVGNYGIDFSPKETEMHATVYALFYEMRMLREIVAFAMLQNKITVRFEQLFIEDIVGQQRQLG